MAEEKKKKGFALMPREKHKEIASAGGKKAHALGKAHQWTSAEAKVAGRRGGKAAHAKGVAHEFTSEEATEAGKLGGKFKGPPKAEREEEE